MSEVLEETPETPEVETPAAETVETPEAAPEPQAPGIDWGNIDTLNEAAQHIAALGYQIVPPSVPEPEPQAEPEYDPFDPESVKAYVAGLVQAEREAWKSEVAPVQAFVAEQQRQSQEHGLTERIAQEREKLDYQAPGEDPAANDTNIRGLAEFLFAQKAQTLPQPTSPLHALQVSEQARVLAEQSVSEAVNWFKEHDAAVKRLGVEEYLNSLTADGSNLLEPGVSGAALQTEGQAVSEMDAAARFLARRNAA